MPVDPMIEAMLAQAPEWPGVRNMDLATLRQSVRDSSVMLPAADDTRVALTEDRTIPGPAGEMRVRIYWPDGEGPFPVTLYMHGGGYVVGDLNTQDMIARALCHWGKTLLVSLDYRLAPEHKFPAAPEDVWAALQWLAAHAGELDGDPARLAVAGDSAGGNLASAAALRARDCGLALAAQINIYGSCNYPSEDRPSAREFADGPILKADDVTWFWEQYLADPGDANDPQASPFRAASHVGLAPAFIGTAECDPSRDDAEAYAEKLRVAGVDVVSKRYSGMVHGFASWVAFLPGAREVLIDAGAFLKDRFGVQDAN
jgi:acetyl esterase